MSEREHAIILANKLLNRQLLRTREQLDELWHFSACPLDHCERCIAAKQIIHGLHEKLGPVIVRAIGKRHSPTG